MTFVDPRLVCIIRPASTVVFCASELKNYDMRQTELVPLREGVAVLSGAAMTTIAITM